MALSNRDRVGRAFEALAAGLGGYVQERLPGVADGDDPAAQLRLLADSWDEAFRGELTRADRNLVFELRDVRNRWADNRPFSADDAYRALDSIERLLVEGQAGLAVRAGERLVNDGRLYVAFPPVLLRMRLDDVLASLWEGGSVRVSALWDAFARYVYLPRLRDIAVLHEAARNGTNSTTWQTEGFATADARDEGAGRYLGLSVRGIHADVTGATLVVRPDIARFYGSVSVEPDRLSRDFGQIVQEVISHLTGTVDTRVEITVEVRAERGDGFPDRVVRVVTQNAKSLGFEPHGFEEH